MVSDNSTPNEPNDRLTQLLLDEIPAPAGDYWTRIDQTLRSAESDVAAGAVRDIGTQPKKTAAALINWRTTPLLIAAAAILIAGLVIVFRNNSETAIDTFNHPTAPLNAALEAMPPVCGAQPSGQTAVDFIDKARQASWYPADGESSAELEVAKLGLRWEASAYTFGFGDVKEYRYGDGFGYDIENSDVVISVSCPIPDLEGVLPSADDTTFAPIGPPVSIVSGSIDLARVDAVTAADPDWGRLRFTTQAGGREYYAYVDENLSLLERRKGPGRPQGFGGQLYVDESLAIRSESRSDVLGAVFVAGPSGDQRRNHDALIDVIRQLADSAMLTVRIYTWPADGDLPEELPIAPTHFINGTADRGAGPRAALAIYHETASDAEINADAILRSGRIGEIGGSLALKVQDRLVTIVFDDPEGWESGRLLDLWVSGLAPD